MAVMVAKIFILNVKLICNHGHCAVTEDSECKQTKQTHSLAHCHDESKRFGTLVAVVVYVALVDPPESTNRTGGYSLMFESSVSCKLDHTKVMEGFNDPESLILV